MEAAMVAAAAAGDDEPGGGGPDPPAPPSPPRSSLSVRLRLLKKSAADWYQEEFLASSHASEVEADKD